MTLHTVFGVCWHLDLVEVSIAEIMTTRFLLPFSCVGHTDRGRGFCAVNGVGGTVAESGHDATELSEFSSV